MHRDCIRPCAFCLFFNNYRVIFGNVGITGGGGAESIFLIRSRLHSFCSLCSELFERGKKSRNELLSGGKYLIPEHVKRFGLMFQT